MTARQPVPCFACARFVPAEAGSGQCTGYEKPRQADDTNEACVLWTEKSSAAGQRIRRTETISRASAQPPK